MLRKKVLLLSNLSLFVLSFDEKLFQKEKKKFVMGLCPATFRSFVVQLSAKFAGRRPQLKPLVIDQCRYFFTSVIRP